MEKNYICTTCGVQYQASVAPPERCLVCEDERQYVNPQGQTWTDQQALRQDHRNNISQVAAGLYQVTTEPAFGIGQRAFLVCTPEGNYLWDCISLIDADTISRIEELGGLKGIAVSHPHFYSTIADWSQAFGRVPVYLPRADAGWVMRPDPAIRFWEGQRLEIGKGLTLIRTGGHFDGSSVLLWADGAEGKGLLLSGDSVFVNMDRKSVSFMYSYPNLIPLRQAAVLGIQQALAGYEFDQIYGAFERHIATKGRQVLDQSLHRYLQIYS